MMNKKYLMLGLPILAIGLVMAGVMAYYGMFSQEITIASAIETDCETTDIDSTFSGETVIGDTCTITNKANTKRIINITNDAPEGIEVSYVGTLELTKKMVNFSSDNWTVLSGDKVQIEYTVVGKDFSAEVVNGSKDGYVLIYYPDSDDRFANPGEAVLISAVGGNLPAVNDENEATNDYSLEYPTTPFGAKIWYIPEESIPTIDWSKAIDFYFESSLIQFNTKGLITVYPGETLDIKPVYELGKINGTYTINTTIA